MRLIDADALFKAFESTTWYDNRDRDETAEDAVLYAPTIDIVPKWISITDRHPKPDNNIKYLVCCRTAKGLRSINLAWFDGAYWHGMGSMSGVTHWMPLPELPEVNSCLS